MIEHVSDELLSAQFDGVLEGPEAARVAGHLGSCDVCSARLEMLSATARVVAALPDEALPAALDLGFLEAAPPVPDPLVLPTGRRWRPPAWAAPVLAAAAVLVVAATLGPSLLRGGNQSSGTTATSLSGPAGGLVVRNETGTSAGLAAGAASAPQAANGADTNARAATGAPAASQSFPEQGGATVTVSAGDPSPTAGRPVTLVLTLRCGATPLQVDADVLWVRHGSAAQQLAAGGSASLTPGQVATSTVTWTAGTVSSGQAAAGDYVIEGDIDLASGQVLKVSLTLHVR